MNVWSIAQETHEKQICLRRNGELVYPDIEALEGISSATKLVAEYTRYALDRMEDDDVLSVLFQAS